MNNYFFYGVVDGNIPEDTWQTLHEHFKKLAREDDVRETQITERKAKRMKEGVRD